MSAIWVSDTEQLPPGEHYAIITNTRYTGFYDEDVYAIQYEAYTSRQEWEARIQDLSNSNGHRTLFKAMYVKPATVKTTISVNVDIKD